MKKTVCLIMLSAFILLLFSCGIALSDPRETSNEPPEITALETVFETVPETETEPPATEPATEPLTETMPETGPETGLPETDPLVTEPPETNPPETEKEIKVDPFPEKRIYLTFDDGPSVNTPRLLDILAEYDVKVTFFLTGYGNPDYITREYNEGHSIGVHSFTHDFYSIYTSVEAYFADLNRMNERIKEKTGEYSYLIRFPGGSSNSVSSYNPGIMSALVKKVEEAGYAYFDWNVSGQDAVANPDRDVIFNNVISGCKGKNDCVVLLHDSKSETVDIVEKLILWGRENGYTFLPLTKDSPTAHHRVNN